MTPEAYFEPSPTSTIFGKNVNGSVNFFCKKRLSNMIDWVLNAPLDSLRPSCHLLSHYKMILIHLDLTTNKSITIWGSGASLYEWVHLFLANVPNLYPLKIRENWKFRDVFRGYKIGTLFRNGLWKNNIRKTENRNMTTSYRLYLTHATVTNLLRHFLKLQTRSLSANAILPKPLLTLQSLQFSLALVILKKSKWTKQTLSCLKSAIKRLTKKGQNWA